MNKTALKKFAISARNELIKKVEARALKIGITEESIKKAQFESSDAIYIDGKQLSVTEKKQRDKLIQRIREIGFKNVMEEVAYTWFNRFIALRFMEINNYLPSKVRVVSSSEPGNPEPDIIKEALSVDLDIEKELVYDLKLNNKTEVLFKYMVIKQCNSLNKYLPFMFETIEDYKEILFPDGLLAKESFLSDMTDVATIPESDWEQVEIIGWLYQYYISEEKTRVIKAKKKYKKEEIPFATQLFTPDWIVRYMVQNTLGRYWVESHPEHRDLINNWEFYLGNSNQDPDFDTKISPYIDKELKVEDLKCFDPAMGSGHILVYVFDVLFDIYNRCGYMIREIPRLILERNLYGVDIDDRAYQLACFSVVMKALQYNSRFLRSIDKEGIMLNLASIQETDAVDEKDIVYFAGESNGKKYEKTKEFVERFKNAKIYGSLIDVGNLDVEFIQARLDEIQNQSITSLFDQESRDRISQSFPSLLKQRSIMKETFDVLITNPPYIGSRYLNDNLSQFTDSYFPDTKTDMFAVFIESSFSKVRENGHMGFMAPFVWMFISSYEKLRYKVIESKTISSLIQLEYSGFDEATVPICTFTLRNYGSSIWGEFIKLSDFTGAVNQPIKVLEAIENPTVYYRYTAPTRMFRDIPGMPIAFWVSEKTRNIYKSEKSLNEIAEPKTGIQTGSNETFLRLWFEVSKEKIGFKMRDLKDINRCGYKWFPYNKGGEFRKWYGNNEYVVNMENEGEDIKKHPKNNYRLRDQSLYFKQAITWSFISSSKFGVRYSPPGFLFDVAGSSVFPRDEDMFYLTAFLCSKLAFEFLKIQNPTLNFQVENIAKLPVIDNVDSESREKITVLCEENIQISNTDWDCFETSWDFKQHPYITFNDAGSIEQAYGHWSCFVEVRFKKLRQNEEALNEMFIDIYGLHDELSPTVNEDDVTINRADIVRDTELFMSYAVGCMFGRYSLDEEGLIFAGGNFDPEKYRTFKADSDNILPILSDAYFEDDIVSRFVEFVKVAFGEDTLTENLGFIADTLGKKDSETPREAIRRYFLNDLFKDHVQTYKKKPIYWLFTSGKHKAFNCLIYMHRYDKTTLSRIRTDYVHELQLRFDAERKSLLGAIEGGGTAREISAAKKELKTLELKIAELKDYEEVLHHLADQQIEIDLDDGVDVNYEKFADLLAKRK